MAIMASIGTETLNSGVRIIIFGSMGLLMLFFYETTEPNLCHRSLVNLLKRYHVMGHSNS